MAMAITEEVIDVLHDDEQSENGRRLSDDTVSRISKEAVDKAKVKAEELIDQLEQRRSSGSPMSNLHNAIRNLRASSMLLQQSKPEPAQISARSTERQAQAQQLLRELEDNGSEARAVEEGAEQAIEEAARAVVAAVTEIETTNKLRKLTGDFSHQPKNDTPDIKPAPTGLSALLKSRQIEAATEVTGDASGSVEVEAEATDAVEIAEPVGAIEAVEAAEPKVAVEAVEFIEAPLEAEKPAANADQRSGQVARTGLANLLRNAEAQVLTEAQALSEPVKPAQVAAPKPAPAKKEVAEVNGWQVVPISTAKGGLLKAANNKDGQA